jgi:hypothetical protein
MAEHWYGEEELIGLFVAKGVDGLEECLDRALLDASRCLNMSPVAETAAIL